MPVRRRGVRSRRRVRARGRTPAAKLLHLGPGLGNAFANLHNARRAHSPILNIVGDHATYHSRYDAPLHTDIAAVASALNGWYRRARADDVAGDAADAIAAVGPPGSDRHAGAACGRVVVATPDRRAGVLVSRPSVPRSPTARFETSPSPAHQAGRVAPRGTRAAPARPRRRGGIAAATGCRVLHETFPAVIDRGADVPARAPQLPRGDRPLAARRRRGPGARRCRLAGQLLRLPEPAVNLVPDGCKVVTLAGLDVDVAGALESLADASTLPGAATSRTAAPRPERPTGALNSASLCAAVGALLPEGCVVVDESNTSGVGLFGATDGAPAHEWLTLTGGAIGYGTPQPSARRSRAGADG